MKKKLKIAGAVIVAGVICLVLFLSTMLGTVIKLGVEEIAPNYLGTPVTIDSIDISIFSGEGSIKGFVIHNPKGFQTGSAIKLDEASISIDVASLLSNTIIINKILIDAPQITYEGTMDSSNMNVIMANVESATASEGDNNKATNIPVKKSDENVVTTSKPQGTGDGKKLIISDFIVKNGKVNISSSLLGNRVITMPLPNIHQKDIGKNSGGASPADVFNQVLGELNDKVGSVANNVIGQLDCVSKNIKKLNDKLGGSSKDLGNTVEEGANKLIEGIGGLFGGDDK